MASTFVSLLAAVESRAVRLTGAYALSAVSFASSPDGVSAWIGHVGRGTHVRVTGSDELDALTKLIAELDRREARDREDSEECDRAYEALRAEVA